MPEIAFLDLPDDPRIAYRLRAGGSDRLWSFSPAMHRTWKGPRRRRSTRWPSGGGSRCCAWIIRAADRARGFRGRNARRMARGKPRRRRPADRGPLILVGSSMGGWIALHLALAPPRPGPGAGRDRQRARLYRLGAATRRPAASRTLSGCRASGCYCLAARSRWIARSGWSTARPTATCRWRLHSGPCARCVHPMCSLRS